MKKLICLFVASVMLVSCSDDNDQKGNPPVAVFTKKIISYDANGDTLVKTAKYSGDKIVSISIASHETEVYTYDGNKISKVVYLDTLGTVLSSKAYVYDDNKLVSCLTKTNGETIVHKVKYEYKSDGTVSFSKVDVDGATGEEGEILGEGTYVYKAGNLVKKEYSHGEQSESIVYEYDNKNVPFKNVLGFGLLLDNEEAMSVNNLVKETLTIGMGNVELITYEYDYNENGFPLKKTKTFHDDTTPVQRTEFVY